MENLDQSNWTIIYTDHTGKYIHSKSLKDSNPNAQVLLADICFNMTDKLYSWRNCDNLIRLWLKSNIASIKFNKIAILEWDVLVLKELPNIEVNGLIAKNIHYPSKNSKWCWFREINNLLEYKNHAIGLSPLAVLFMDKKTIETWIDNRFDYIYEKNIFCELRLPTILNSQNISIKPYDLPYVFAVKQYNYNHYESEIYHPIKEPYE